MSVDTQSLRDEELLDKMIAARQSIMREIRKAIIGQDEVVEQVLISLFVGGHSIITGVPGLAKTLLVRTISSVLDLSFKRIQFTPDLMPADITGTEIIEEDRATGKRELQFIRGPVFANIILADEINRTPPKTQSALLEAMQEGSVTVAGSAHRLDQPFFVMATQNPIEMEGTYPLPEAQLDRFFFKVNVSRPSVKEMVEIFDRTTSDALPAAQIGASGADILSMRALARAVPVASHVKEYIAALTLATHPENEHASPLVKKYVRYGASPRGGQSLMLGAKVTALLAGRYNVAFEDVHAVAPAALRHRLILNFGGLAEGVSADDVIREVVAEARQVHT